LSSTGAVEIELPDDDPQAFEILLNIIYSKLKQVPRGIDLNMLTRISILIDKYYFHKAAMFFTNMWFDAIEPQVLVVANRLRFGCESQAAAAYCCLFCLL
jgi:hypothetical protein